VGVAESPLWGRNLGGGPGRLLSVRSSSPAESAAQPGPGQDLDRHLPALRSALLQQRRFRIAQLADLRKASQDDAAREHDDAAQEEVRATLRRGARIALAGIEAALARMDRGGYGACVECAAPIPVERLEILPAVDLCMTCQSPAS
jgi:RNA polymerase-binding transcription factor